MILFAGFLVVHGLIHLLGFVKAFDLAPLPQLTQRIPPAVGVAWLAACALFLATAAALFLLPRWWWALGVAAIVVSMAAILYSWTDAKFGALPTLIAMIGVVYGFLAAGPASLRAAYEKDVARALAAPAPVDVITESHLAGLPDPVRRYLRNTGVVGLPRVHNFRARMHGRIRGSREARWIPLEAEQYNFIDEPARMFYLSGSMFMLPVQGYHRYVGASATMLVKAAALVPVASASGDIMTSSETVTLFNDMCVLAPGSLVERGIVWEAVNAHTVRARYTHAGHTIHATLSFNDAGDLVDFSSDDRYELLPEGITKQVRWSTPLRNYRSFGAVRLASGGEGHWHEGDGEYAYIELTIDDVAYNVSPR